MKLRMQTGSTLFEVMVSIFVISLGFLGFAKLQTNSLAMANGSLLRGSAVYLSYAMTDRMRANIPAVQAGAYNSLTVAVADPGCVSTGCTPAQMAQSDYYEWAAEAASLLPSGRVVVCLDSNPDLPSTPDLPGCDNAGNVLAIKVWWMEKGTLYRFVSGVRP